MVNHIFVGIDLGDKNSVSRMGVDREKTERFGFVNSRRGRARLFREAKRRSEQAGGGEDHHGLRGLVVWVCAQ